MDCAVIQLSPFRLGDLNNDGFVGVDDFIGILTAWGPCPDPCPPFCLGDLNGDCIVGVDDFILVLTNWG